MGRPPGPTRKNLAITHIRISVRTKSLIEGLKPPHETMDECIYRLLRARKPQSDEIFHEKNTLERAPIDRIIKGIAADIVAKSSRKTRIKTPEAKLKRHRSW